MTSDSIRLNDLCEKVFESLPRSDQRRWAELYVRGLVSVPGRKSIRRISEQVTDRSIEQCLQQFVNQSPWDWALVRHVLARTTDTALQPRAWVVQEVEFLKDGRNSVGVGTQYVHRTQRTINCQLALATWLAAEAGSVPVNWRLMLPPAWDTDVARRAKSHLPETERHRPCWEHVLDTVDEMVESWDLSPSPVISDRRHDRQLDPLLCGLEERGMRYAIRITETAAQAIDPVDRASPRTTPSPSRPRRVVTRWQRGHSRPHQRWLTNLAPAQLSELPGSLDLAEHTAAALAELREESGLDHFEGRSFRGWHHHVTLASVAHAHRVLQTHRESRSRVMASGTGA